MSTVSTNSLTESLYSADSVRAMDRYLIDRKGVDGFELMQSAASAAFRQLMSVWPGQPSLLVFCGAGNNGGDGYLIAASARRHGLKAMCVAVAPAEKLAGDALLAYNKACADGVTLLDLRQLSEDETEQLAAGADVLVDAMLGTGFAGSPRESFASAIQLLNRSGKPVLAVDVPSGLDATTGAAIAEVVRADITVTFIGAKLGLYTGAGAGVCGRVIFEPLVDTATAQASGEQALAELCRWQQCRSRFPRRALDAHKGDFGHVLVVAGDHGFGGAGILAAEAASRTGAGLVSLATRPEYVTAALARCPSVMVRGVTHGSELPALLLKADVVVCGPGLGQSSWGHQMLQQVVESGKPRVLDADALNIMAGRAPAPSRHHVLTPHPGEAARLLGCSVQEIEANRLVAATSLQKQWRGIVLLKGAGTVIATESSLPRIIPGGNPGMATGGMGDVLSGILGALLAQVTVPESAVTLAASLHLAAANAAVKTQGYMGLLPTDVINCLPETLRLAETDVNSENRENG